MKIKEFNPSIHPSILPEKGRAETAGSLDFQKLLQDAGNRLKNTATLQTSESPTPVFSASFHGLAGSEDLSKVRSQSLKAVEETLNLLGEYQKSLSDPSVSPKKIVPFIQDLSEEVEGLHRLAEKLHSSDPLKAILTEAGVLSVVEIERFSGGDYF